MRGVRIVIGAVLVTTVALIAGCSGSGDQSSAGGGFVAGDGSIVVLSADRRVMAPDFTGTEFDGTSITLSSLRGKVVVLNVWASWCAPCRAEAPFLERTWQQFQGKPVQFIGLDTRDSQAAAEAFIERYGLTYPSVVDDGSIQVLFRDSLPPQAIPSTLVIDKQGRVAARVLGEVTESTLLGIINPLLAEGSS